MSGGFVTPKSIAQDRASSDGAVFYAVGICHASVCVPAALPIDAILDAANARWPTGLGHGWMIATAEAFADWWSNPCTCEQDPTRVHRLLEC